MLNYSPQTKFAKVMFSQVFVCSQRGSQSLSTGLCQAAFCPGVSVCEGLWPEGVSVKGVSVQGGVCPGVRGRCPGRSLSRGISFKQVSVQGVSVQGVSVQGGLCPGGLCPGGSLSRGLCPGDEVSLSRESLSRGMGVSVQGVSVRETPCTVTNGQYESYWNAFLFSLFWYRHEILATSDCVHTLTVLEKHEIRSQHEN